MHGCGRTFCCFSAKCAILMTWYTPLFRMASRVCRVDASNTRASTRIMRMFASGSRFLSFGRSWRSAGSSSSTFKRTHSAVVRFGLTLNGLTSISKSSGPHRGRRSCGRISMQPSAGLTSLDGATSRWCEAFWNAEFLRIPSQLDC